MVIAGHFFTVRVVSLRIRFHKAVAEGVVLAKVGHPQRNEALQTSKEVCRIAEEDREPLTKLLLKPFKSLAGYCFRHHASLDQNEIYSCAKSIFSSPETLLAKGCEIATRLYEKSHHPNIKSGDLCVTLIRNVLVDGEPTEALCILKSETVEPFLSITNRDGDLKLSTEHGISPEKIDKGCLVLNHAGENGFYVLTFDRAGAQSRFWIRDFLALQPITDEAFLTDQYANMAVSFLQKPKGEDEGDAPERTVAAKRAVNYFDERDHFSLQEFEEEVLRQDPEMVAKFKEHRERHEEESGLPLKESFGIAKQVVQKARKRVGGVMKLDTGVEIRLQPEFQEEALERGFDEERGMGYVKIYFNEDLALRTGSKP